MAYDQEKDVELGAGLAFEGDKTKVWISAHRYDGGNLKFQFTRTLTTSHGDTPIKLGRLTYDEILGVAAAAESLFNTPGVGLAEVPANGRKRRKAS